MAAAMVIGLPLLTALAALFSERSKPKPKAEKPALNRDSDTRAAWITFAIWAVLTAGGLYLTLTYDFYRTVASDKGQEISDAFRVLTALAVPVAAMVLAVLGYSIFRRGSMTLSEEDGPAYHGSGPVPRIWLGVTAGLTLLIIIYPGLTTLHDVVKNPDRSDLVVDVEGVQWTWLVSYPDENISTQPELVLPVDRTVTFKITSRDVIHSFWIPAMLLKIDAVPGQTNTLTFKPTEVGDYATDPLYRLQCAELCGLGHASMRIPVRVLSQDDFDQWVSQKQSSAAVATGN